MKLDLIQTRNYYIKPRRRQYKPISEDHSQTEDNTLHDISKPIWESKATPPIIEYAYTNIQVQGSKKQVAIYVTTENNLGSSNHTNHLCANRDEPHDEYDADICPSEESYHSHLNSDEYDEYDADILGEL
uniref:Uncharacterized protein n=1 Tax=Lactuca sativa TaxID=4236 RepID=A0A9R1ULJ7_LACSA|nr:hypothetical protein LSAT_V11C800395080 [Lactuca sativa]